MKTRNGFVSNSSSSSFLIPINALETRQIGMILDHIKATENWSKYEDDDNKIYCDYSNRWDVNVNERCVWGYTFMDNFDMRFFLKEIAKVDDKYIYWGDEHENTDLDLDAINREILQEERKDKLIEIDNK